MIPDNNDCSVVSTSLVTGLSYEEAYYLLKKHGRIKGNSFAVLSVIKAVKSIGYEVIHLSQARQPNGCRYTVKTIGRLAHTGTYLVCTDNHMLAVIDGEVLDWTKGRKFWVELIYKLERKDAKR